MKPEKNILIAFLLNLFFSIFEFIGGLFTNSIAIISDAIHDFGDSISIGISYFLEKKSKKQPDDLYTYGYARYSLLGGIITTTILVIGSIIVIYNAIIRIINPVDINYNGMLILAIIGVIINFIACYFTKDPHSLNQKAVNLHMLEDVLGWVVVLIGAVIMKFTSISVIDPILSLIVAIFILISALKNIKSIINIFLEKAPVNINIPEIKEELLKLKEIKDVHHIHVWTLDGFNNYATLHIITEGNSEDIKNKIRKCFHEFNINHVTIEIETQGEECTSIDCKIEEKHKGHHHHH